MSDQYIPFLVEYFLNYILTFIFQCTQQILVVMDDSAEDFTKAKDHYLQVHYMHIIVVFIHDLLFIISAL